MCPRSWRLLGLVQTRQLERLQLQMSRRSTALARNGVAGEHNPERRARFRPSRFAMEGATSAAYQNAAFASKSQEGLSGPAPTSHLMLGLDTSLDLPDKKFVERLRTPIAQVTMSRRVTTRHRRAGSWSSEARPLNDGGCSVGSCRC